MRTVVPGLLFLALSSVACHQEPIYRARSDKDIPPEPSFTVIPRNDYPPETNFAQEIEAYLMNIGVRLIRRPAFKAVETNKQLAGIEADAQRTGVASASMTEKYYSLEETSADYIVETSVEKQAIRILRKTTREVLCSTRFNPSQEDPEAQVYEILKAIGISARDGYKPQRWPWSL